MPEWFFQKNCAHLRPFSAGIDIANEFHLKNDYAGNVCDGKQKAPFGLAERGFMI
jgi:hypothetical protein